MTHNQTGRSVSLRHTIKKRRCHHLTTFTHAALVCSETHLHWYTQTHTHVTVALKQVNTVVFALSFSQTEILTVLVLFSHIVTGTPQHQYLPTDSLLQWKTSSWTACFESLETGWLKERDNVSKVTTAGADCCNHCEAVLYTKTLETDWGQKLRLAEIMFFSGITGDYYRKEHEQW